jgi:hypothetical protein
VDGSQDGDGWATLSIARLFRYNCSGNYNYVAILLTIKKYSTILGVAVYLMDQAGGQAGEKEEVTIRIRRASSTSSPVST